MEQALTGLVQSLLCGSLASNLCLTLLQLPGLQPTRLLCPQDFPSKNTRVGCHFLLQGIFPTQESNDLLHWQVDSLLLSHQGSPSKLISRMKIGKSKPFPHRSNVIKKVNVLKGYVFKVIHRICLNQYAYTSVLTVKVHQP